MNLKNIFAIIIFVVSGLFFYSFVLPFKEAVVDTAEEQQNKLSLAYEQATQQLSLKTLRLKKEALTEDQLIFLKSFIPTNLHSGEFVYNLAQYASQNSLVLKGIQYTIIDDTALDQKSEKRLLVELKVDGRYENFVEWLKKIERSNVLIDIESFKGEKISNNSEIISFYVKLYAYGINID